MLPPVLGNFGGKEAAISLLLWLYDKFPEAERAGPGLISEASLALVTKECCELFDDWVFRAELACKNIRTSQLIKQPFHG